MTCIVALKADDGRVIMGADSAGADERCVLTLKEPKIARVGGALIGYTSSFRMGQLLAHSLTLPEHHADVPVEKYMATSFVNAVRNCFKDGGYSKRENDIESGGTFLIAYRGRIFHVQDNYSVIESAESFDSCGSGFLAALGSLHSTNPALLDLDPMKRVQLALDAAQRFCVGVRGPMHIDVLEAA